MKRIVVLALIMLVALMLFAGTAAAISARGECNKDLKERHGDGWRCTVKGL